LTPFLFGRAFVFWLFADRQYLGQIAIEFGREFIGHGRQHDTIDRAADDLGRLLTCLRVLEGFFQTRDFLGIDVGEPGMKLTCPPGWCQSLVYIRLALAEGTISP